PEEAEVYRRTGLIKIIEDKGPQTRRPSPLIEPRVVMAIKCDVITKFLKPCQKTISPDGKRRFFPCTGKEKLTICGVGIRKPIVRKQALRTIFKSCQNPTRSNTSQAIHIFTVKNFWSMNTR